jgi:radical SAM PhpK family P-methyltransferase
MFKNLDCIIVGHHDPGFRKVAEEWKLARDYSGGYRALRADSVLLHGKRVPHMDLLNHVLTKATGRQSELHVTELPNLGACYLKSYLRRRDISAEIVNSFTHGRDELRDMLSQSVNAVAITTTLYVDYSPLIEIVDFIREHNPSTKIIIGGPHIYNLCSGHDDSTLSYILDLIKADIYVFDSQGELTLSRVLLQLRDSRRQDLSSIPNLIYKDGSTYRKTPRVAENNDMDENGIDWSYFEDDFLRPTVQTRTARSCAFKCAFCSYPAMAGPLHLASLETVERELNYLREIGVRNLVFVDDTFNVPLPRFKEICRVLSKHEFSWYSYFRCSNADDEAFDLMQQSGCAGVFLGIESGDKNILYNMNKFAVVERYVAGIRKLNARGILTFASLIVGFPGETAETVRNTIDFVEEASPTFYRAELYWHDTQVKVPVQDKAGEYGLRGGGYGWKHNSMDWREAGDWVEFMYRNIKNSTILPSYMFNFWTIPYLVGKGISPDRLKRFASIAQEMLVSSLDDARTDFSEQEGRLVALFQEPRA